MRDVLALGKSLAMEKLVWGGSSTGEYKGMYTPTDHESFLVFATVEEIRNTEIIVERRMANRSLRGEMSITFTIMNAQITSVIYLKQRIC